MNAIAFNLLNGAVTEYSGMTFQSVTPTHAGDVTGLYAWGGDMDHGQPIIARVVTGKKLQGTAKKKGALKVHVSIISEGESVAIVQGSHDEWQYPLHQREKGAAFAKSGAGIKENYLAFGYTNPGGQVFAIDKIEVDMPASTNRRV